MSRSRRACAVALVSAVGACNMDQLYEVHVARPDGGAASGGMAGATGSVAATGASGSTGSGGSAGNGSGASAGGSGGATSSGPSGPSGTAGSAGVAGAGGGAGSIATLDAAFDALADAGPADVVDASAPNCAGQALLLEGSSYLEVARPVQDDFTLEAWIKTTASRSGTQWYHGNGLFYADVGGAANDFGSSILGDRFAFGVGNPDTTILSASTVTTGRWVHVAATRRKSTGEIQVFVDGKLESTMTTAQTGSLTAQSIMAVGANTIDGLYFLGAIDEVRVWSVVRSAAEIAASLHVRLTGTEAGLVAYYRFDEEDGPNATDSSMNQKNALLVGGSNRVPSEAPVCP